MEMKVAFGFKPHSGWAVLVAIAAGRSGRVELIDRRRIALVDDGEGSWAKQPYHAAQRAQRDEPGARDEAERLVARGVESARRLAIREVRDAARRIAASGHEVAAGAVLMSDPLPDWSVDEILAVHVRMHKAEGVLFREALARAVSRCGLRLVQLSDRKLQAEAAAALGAGVAQALSQIDRLRQSCGAPWGQDQKDAALAAWIALRRAAKSA